MVAQSISFLIAPEGEPVRDEQAPVHRCSAPFDTGVEAALDIDGRTGRRHAEARRTCPALRLLRRPGTYYASDGYLAEETRKRRQPIVGGGHGLFSFATWTTPPAPLVAAVERGASGVYNICDDDPAPMTNGCPLRGGARSQEAVRDCPSSSPGCWPAASRPAWPPSCVARPMPRPSVRLGWEPRYPSWRAGFRQALGVGGTGAVVFRRRGNVGGRSLHGGPAGVVRELGVGLAAWVLDSVLVLRAVHPIQGVVGHVEHLVRKLAHLLDQPRALVPHQAVVLEPLHPLLGLAQP